MEKEERVIDTKIPLTWLISAAGSVLGFLILVLWNVAGLSNTMNNVSSQMSDMKKSVESISLKADVTKESIYTIQRTMDAHALRLEALERARK